MTVSIPGREATAAETDSRLRAAWANRCQLAGNGRSEADMAKLAEIDRQIAEAQGVGPAGRKIKAALLLALCDEEVFDQQEEALIRTLLGVEPT